MVAASFAQETSDPVSQDETKLEGRGYFGGYGGYGGYGGFRRFANPYGYTVYGGYRRPFYGGYGGFYRSGEEPSEKTAEVNESPVVAA